MYLVVVVLVILVLLGSWPGFGLHPYGYWPGGVLGMVVVVVLILALVGRL